jgi:hypothetical protein
MQTFEPIVSESAPPPQVTNTVTVSDVYTNKSSNGEPGRKQKKRLRHSNYLILINTNKSFIDGQDPDLLELIKKLRECLKTSFASENIGKYVTFPKNPTHAWNTDWIKSCNVESVIERGKGKNFLHAHVRCKISHWSCIQVNFDLMREDLKKELDIPGIFIRYKRQDPTDDDLMEDYINKDVVPGVASINIKDL